MSQQVTTPAEREFLTSFFVNGGPPERITGPAYSEYRERFVAAGLLTAVLDNDGALLRIEPNYSALRAAWLRIRC